LFGASEFTPEMEYWKGGMMEHRFSKDINHFNIIVTPAGGGTIHLSEA
jgi:hypothetical protein